MKAIVMQGRNGIAVINNHPVPSLEPGYILVRVRAIALNPVDWKTTHTQNTPGVVLGYDFAGTVEKTGSGYDKDWSVGDRICGVSPGANPLKKQNGAFAEWIVAKADVQYRIPEWMTFEDAATLGVGVGTAGMGLFHYLGLKLSPEHEKPPTSQQVQDPEPVFIYGGSTATGTISLQVAKWAGYAPLTTCSPHNVDLVKSCGAVEAFDYHLPSWPAAVRNKSTRPIKFAWDTVVVPASVSGCCDVLAGIEPRYASTLPPPVPIHRKDVTGIKTLLPWAFGEKVDIFGFKFDPRPDDYEFLKKWVRIAEQLIAEKAIMPHPKKVMDGGLDGVESGLELLMRGEVSGEKLVYTL